ncbi:hypothetical protein [Methylobacterium sp. 17Sr1-1]|uniref:hypothetical protein n=1 Tax=Methylobacterium sp. 17Sr1-1 TaxID=2202826 RepID=UPI000D6EFC00|nr:hypothetical protein [Methylobacterium sp. 17Sr1-1]AWN55215.1 hypothetical protein DK412_29310 [Methylobacterium sp. 17Sr1-1]
MDEGIRVAVVSLPLRLSVSLGPASVETTRPAPAASEAVAREYRDRDGYRADILGPGFAVPLPRVTRAAGDVLTVDDGIGEASVLHDQHVSVVMRRPISRGTRASSMPA